MRDTFATSLLVMSLVAIGACTDQSSVGVDAGQSDESHSLVGIARGKNSLLVPDTDIIDLRPAANPDRNAYFGDLHVHTANSFDAYAFGTLATPRDAYRYAKGDAIPHPSGYEVQLLQPLDFYAVTDHAMFLGVVKQAADTSTAISKLPMSEPLHNINAPDNMTEASLPARGAAFQKFVPALLAGLLDGSIDQSMTKDIGRAAWMETIAAAEEAYIPGTFTSFVAYEYTSSSDDRGNLHRNVIFEGSDKLPAAPFSRLNSQNPEGLWDWMDDLRERGVESLAIPHNSNGSNGQMFKLEDWAGNPIDDEYASRRMRNEPLVEITQVKGTSDTHPLLSKNDEWADFEIAPFRVATKLYSEPSGGYVRQAYLNGLALENAGVSNPYKFGLIGASDTHTGASSDQESNFFSKAGMIDGTAELRGSIPVSKLYGAVLRVFSPDILTSVEDRDYIAASSFETWGASGLAGVWAEENTREAIYQALRRKETFATTGPRISLRFFAGYDYPTDLFERHDGIQLAYRGGVAMGGDLAATADHVPTFLVWGLADPNGVSLQRLQIIKGYTEGGKHVEKIYDVSCSDGLEVDPSTHRCPDNGAKVNLADCSITADVGDSELKTVWRDPEFNPAIKTFYYVRALENPSCRWSTWDAVRAGTEPRPDLKKTIQERAWSSPIWLSPNGGNSGEGGEGGEGDGQP